MCEAQQPPAGGASHVYEAASVLSVEHAGSSTEQNDGGDGEPSVIGMLHWQGADESTAQKEIGGTVAPGGIGTVQVHGGGGDGGLSSVRVSR